MKNEATEKEVKPVSICLTPTLTTRLDTVAKRQVTSRSLLIRQACEKYLRELETQEAAA